MLIAERNNFLAAVPCKIPLDAFVDLTTGSFKTPKCRTNRRCERVERLAQRDHSSGEAAELLRC